MQEGGGLGSDVPSSTLAIWAAGGWIVRMGESDKANLEAELERAGWSVQRLPSADWWIHETWQLSSTWRPVGTEAFITLLVDPQAQTSDVDSVWAVAISKQQPADRLEVGRNDIRVSPHWPERMKEIVAAVGLLRPAE